jgi:ubiquinone/menaquinone biosynthesis C-methylase UbiE
MFNDISIIKVKEYWNNRPCNIRHSLKELGTTEYYEEVKNRKYFVESHIPKFAEFEKWKDKKVLEIGCGIGTDTLSFLQHGAYVTAVDVSEESIRIAEQRIKLFGFESTHARFFHGNAEELSKFVPIEKYDLIYSFGVIHHTPNPENVLNEIKKYMGPDSILKVMVYNKLSWKVFWIWATFGHFCSFRDLDGLIARYSEAQTGCPVTYSYTKKSVKELLKNFKIIDMRIDHIFPYDIKSYKNHQYKKVWYFRWMPDVLFRILERILGWHICITAIS